MAVRLHEVHPALVHYPIALLPIAVIADSVGYLAGSRRLLQTGRWATLLAAGSAALAGVAGLVAQEEVETRDDEAHDLLVSHRTLNLGLTLATGLLAAWRWRRRAPTAASLAIAATGLGVMGYSAYLGGKMVYEHGVGVRRAGGLKPGRGKELWMGQLAEAAEDARHDLPDAMQRTADDIAAGDLLPHMDGRRHEPGDEVGY